MLLPCVLWLARPYLTSSLAIFLLPVLTMGSFYATGSSWFLGQAEAIASPLYMIVALSVVKVVDDPAKAMRFAVISGLATGLVALMKPVFVLVPVVCWLVASFYYIRQGRFKAFVGLAGVGASISLLPLAIVSLVYLIAGELDVLLALLFVEPFEMAASWGEGPNWNYLKESLKWIAPFAPALILALWVLWRNQVKCLSTLVSVVIGWGIGVGIIIAVQPQSWWSYHFVPVIAVVGVLVVFAVESEFARRKTRTRTSILVLLALAPWVSLRAPLSTYILYGIPTTDAQKINYQTALNDVKGPIAKYLRVSEPLRQMDESPREIFVFGNPLIYYLSNTLQAIRMNGWWPENFSDRQWSALILELQEKLPEMIFVDRFYDSVIARRSPEFKHQFNTSYIAFHHDIRGTWYKLQTNQDQ